MFTTKPNFYGFIFNLFMLKCPHKLIFKHGLEKMITLPRLLVRCSLVVLIPAAANAAGTYYTGNYQSPQQRYAAPAYNNNMRGVPYNGNAPYGYRANGGYNNASYASMRNNNQNMAGANNRTNAANSANASRQNQNASRNASTGNGFTIGADITHQMASWEFKMKDAGSELRYDDLSWNVLGVNAAYEFDVGSMKLRADAGFQYGMQSGEIKMTDDDISKGGYFITSWCESIDENGNCVGLIGDQMGHALSIGTSDGGKMYGFNVGFGLVDVFRIGNIKFTPSVGYRYLKYELETKKNHGLSVDSAACFTTPGTDEVQCDPAIIFVYKNGQQQILWRENADTTMDVAGDGYVDTQGTYYYYQPGTSHSYDVDWSGPYVAMDMAYDINQNNSVNGRVELGFPGYKSTGDQPYRPDWAHPKSVEDKAGMFSAFHLGLAANWMTALTNTISLSLGVTYDYYTIGDADAKTYLNGDYYMKTFNNYLTGGEIDGIDWGPGYQSEEELIANNKVAANIAEIRDECPGWVCSSNGEIESFYKSLGVRLGIVAKF